jgi:Protein of unknown function (DUF1559)
MRRLTALAVFLALAAPAAAAERKYDPEGAAKTIAPFLDEQTFFVGHADLSRIDFDKALALFKQLGKFEDKELEKPAAEVKGWLDAFRKAGGRDVYLVVSMADLPQEGAFIVAPIGDKADEEALAKLFPIAGPGTETKYLTLHKCVVVGTAKVIDRVQDLKPAERPEVAKAFVAAGDSDAQLLLVPTEDSRKVVEQFLPELPKELGGGPTITFTRGVDWIALGVNAPPKARAHLVIQSADRDSAKILQKEIKGVFEAIKKLPADSEPKTFIPNLDKVLDAFTPEVKEDRLLVSIDDKQAIELLAPVVASIRTAAGRMQSMNNLRQMTLAMHNYHDTYGKFPAAYTVDKDDKPLLSWRVHILPYIEQDALYKEFHLDEPWDSEHNKKLIPRMPKVYLSSDKLLEGMTGYVAPIGDATIFPGKDAVKITDITDGTSNTVILMEADEKNSVIWTKPDDLKVDPKKPEAGLAVRDGKGYLMAFADGSVRMVSKTVDKKTLWAIFTRNGGEPVDLP